MFFRSITDRFLSKKIPLDLENKKRKEKFSLSLSLPLPPPLSPKDKLSMPCFKQPFMPSRQ
jgi:hypothetical protein